MKQSNSVKDALISIPFSIISVLPLSFVRATGNTLGKLAYFLNIELVKVTKRNLSLCYPDQTESKIGELCQASIQHTFTFGLETSLIWQRDKAWFDTQYQLAGEDKLIEAVACKQGVIILAPHIGNWEVLGKKLPDFGSVVNLYAPPKNKSLEAFIKTGREASGATLVPTNSRGIAKILKHLKTGGITGILPDQVPPKTSGEYSEFFGVTALTMTLLHGLVSRTHCKILVAAALRNEQNFTIHFIDPDERIYADDLQTSLLGLNKSVENIIAYAPEQYQWEYKRFKRQKDKRISYYDF